MLKHYAKGIQRDTGDSIIGAVLQTFQIFDKLIQFLWMEEQYKLTQILRNILGKLKFANFKAFCQFDSNFISLIPGKHRSQFYKRFPCCMTDRNLFADFQQIGQMGCHMKFRHGNAAANSIIEQTHVDDLDFPWCCRFQVIQENIRYHCGIFKDFLICSLIFLGQTAIFTDFIGKICQCLFLFNRHNI